MKKVDSQVNDSLRRRYLFKVIANSVGLVGNIIIQALVPRALGPRAFGNFSFLTHFFAQVLEFVDGRSSTGAIVKVSLRPNESGLVVYYTYFSIVMSGLVVGLVWLINSLGFAETFWPGQGQKFIFFGALWAICVWLSGILHKVCDAHGLTVAAEKARSIQKTVGAIIILVMFSLNVITLETFFYYYFGLLSMMAVQFYYILSSSGKWPQPNQWILPFYKTKEYFFEYYRYSLPLLIVIGVEAFAHIFDRWLLQSARGSEEQGHFGFAFQIGQMSFLFAGAMSPLIQREFSRAFAMHDIESMAQMFRRYFPLLFTIAAYFACFTTFQADRIIDLFAGNKYSASFWPIVILSFFPIYQAYGQLLGSVFFATENNRLFRNIGILVFLFGAIISYVLVAPLHWYGLGLGAVGLASKMVVVQVIFVNVLLYYNCSLLHESYFRYLLKQVRAISGLLALAFISRWLTGQMIGSTGQVLTKFLVDGTLYTFLVILLFLFSPRVLGVHEAEFARVWRGVLQVFSYFKQKKDTLEAVDCETKNFNVMNSFVGRKESLPFRKYRILLLGARSSIHAVKWLNGLADRGHEVHLVSMHSGTEELHPDVTVHRLEFGPPWGYFFNFFRLRKILKILKPDILHAHYASGYGTMAILSGFRPTMLSVWGSDIFSFPFLSIVNYWVMVRNLKLADWVCSTSHVMADQVCSINKKVRGRISVTPFGVDHKKFKPMPEYKNKNKIVIGTVKTLLRQYGVDVFIRGFARAIEILEQEKFERVDDVVLLIVGGGAQRGLLERLVAQLNLSQRTTFAGVVPNSEVPEYMNQLDIYVAVSREESFGVAILEASSCGIPTIVSDAGGLKEVVDDGVSGFIVPVEDYEALAQVLVDLVKNKDRRDVMGRAGRDLVVRRYSWEHSLEKMEHVYGRILAKKKKDT